MVRKGEPSMGARAGGPDEAREPRSTGFEPDPLWYKDAVIYEVPVRAFADSSGDGIGDFRGLTSRLDYLADLGVTADLAAALLPLTAARRRLRHRRLRRGPSRLRHAA